MAFGLGKSEKRPDNEDEPPANTPEGSEDAPADDPAGEVADGVASAAEAPDVDGQGEEETSYQPMAFRPAFLDEAESHEEKRGTTTPPPRGDAFFVSVTREETAEVHRFNGPAEARTFVEQLLEEGVPQENVAAFSGRRLALRVSHRPVAKLFSDQED